MRRTALALAALLLAAGSRPALAGGGLPKLVNVDVGPHTAELYNDSPTLVTGANTLTVQVRGLSAEHTVALWLDGPDGTHIPVALAPVLVLGEPEGEHSHGGGGDDHAVAAPADSHVAAQNGHAHDEAAGAHGAAPSLPVRRTASDRHSVSGSGPAAADQYGIGAPVASGAHPLSDGHAAADPHADAADDTPTGSGSYLARGTATVPRTGAWTVRVVIRDAHGDEVAGEAPLIAAQGGPNRLYLGFTGTLIFGSMLFGMIQRRRGHARAAVAR